jgi:hypothetical protein
MMPPTPLFTAVEDRRSGIRNLWLRFVGMLPD